MKTTILIGILAAAIASAACVHSVNPFYEQKDIFFDQSLVGTWINKEGTESWKVQRQGEKEYLIDEKDEKGEMTRLEARLFKLGSRTFIDLASTAPAGPRSPDHTFLAIEIDRCSSKVAYLDPTWLKAHLAQNPSEIRHSKVDGEIVFTDSTANLQSFVTKHLTSAGAFEEAETLFKKGETQCEQKS